MIALSLVFPLGVALAGPLSLDLDGDKKPEQIVTVEDAVKVGALSIPCESTECLVEAHDISGADAQRELAVCEQGPRDDSSCALWTLRAGKLAQVKFPGDIRPGKILTSGNGVVLTEEWAERMYQRRSKYTLKDGALVLVRQPIYAANNDKIHADNSFDILFAPDGKEVVGTVRADSDLVLLGEHGEKPRWYLVKLSSGIAGWVSFDVLVKSSTELQRRMAAG